VSTGDKNNTHTHTDTSPASASFTHTLYSRITQWHDVTHLYPSLRLAHSRFGVMMMMMMMMVMMMILQRKMPSFIRTSTRHLELVLDKPSSRPTSDGNSPGKVISGLSVYVCVCVVTQGCAAVALADEMRYAHCPNSQSECSFASKHGPPAQTANQSRALLPSAAQRPRPLNTPCSSSVPL